MSLKTNEKEDLKNKPDALLEKGEEENAVTKIEEAESIAETSLIISASVVSEDEHKMSGELEEKAALSTPQNQKDNQLLSTDSARGSPKLSDDVQMQTLQVCYCNNQVFVDSFRRA